MVTELPTGSTHTPPVNISYGRASSRLEIGDAFSLFANPDAEARLMITLIAPPIYFSKNSYSTPLTMPLGVAYLAAVLEKSNYPVQIIDCPGRDANNIFMSPDGPYKVQGLDEEKSIALIDSQTDIIGVSIMFSQEWPQVRNYINRIRQAFPEATIVVGGEHPTAMSEYTLRDCPAIDYLVRGEGELALLELIHRLRSGNTAEGIGGVVYLKDGQFIESALSPRVADIRQMPWPAWHLMDVEPYFQPNFTMGISHGRNIAMLATRGCPYQCTFCSSPSMWTTRYVMRPVADVVDEIVSHIANYGINSIDFYDLTAIIKRDWILQFIAELERRDVRISWQLPSGTRSESLDDEVLKGLARTGCDFLVYAPESGSQRTLNMIKKRVNLRNLEVSIAAAVKNGITSKLNFIIGFPFETRADIFQTLLFAWKMACKKVDDCNISAFSPYPGSELFAELQRDEAFGSKIDDDYFATLMTQFDFTVTKTFCRHVPTREILLYRVMGMMIFYVLSYLRSPTRFLRLVKGVFQTHFQPRSLFEQRIYDLIMRWKHTLAAKRTGLRADNAASDLGR
jgi:anaerobic magnesium-protoporphyrin IX monomethyl ester cyclase